MDWDRPLTVLARHRRPLTTEDVLLDMILTWARKEFAVQVDPEPSHGRHRGDRGVRAVETDLKSRGLVVLPSPREVLDLQFGDINDHPHCFQLTDHDEESLAEGGDVVREGV